MTRQKPPDPVPLILEAFKRRIPHGQSMGMIRISNIGSKCDRQIYLNALPGFTIDEAGSTSIAETHYLHIGNTIHLFYEDICQSFVDEYKDALFEKRFFDRENNVTGQTDIWSKKKQYIVDFKTTSKDKFQKVKKSNEIAEEYVWQFNGYCLYREAIDGYIVFIDRDTRVNFADGLTYHPMHSVYLKADKKIQKQIIERIHRINDHLKRKEEPPIPGGFNKNTFPCSWCAFKSHCWK